MNGEMHCFHEEFISEQFLTTVQQENLPEITSRKPAVNHHYNTA